MKKHIFVLVLVFLTACSTPLKLSDKDSGTHQTVRAGQRVVISLAENPTTGYSWQFFITPAKQNTITDTARPRHVFARRGRHEGIFLYGGARRKGNRNGILFPPVGKTE